MTLRPLSDRLLLSEQKRRLRAHYRHLRAGFDPAKIRDDSAALWARLAHQYNEAQAGCAHLLFVGVRGEVDTRAQIQSRTQRGFATYLPRIDALPRSQQAGQMTFFRHQSQEQWEPGRMGLWEPPDDAPRWDPREDRPTIAIVPGLAFDSKGGRLGQGGGFYDAFLAQHRDAIALRIGVCFEEQLHEAPLPMDELDQAVDWVVTPQRIWIIQNPQKSPEDRGPG